MDSLRQNRAHPTVLAAAKLMHCTACQESARMLSRPVTSGKVMEPGAVLQMDNFYWKHPLKEVHVKGTLLVDASSRAAVIRIWRTASRQELLGNVSASEARQMLQESWFKFYGRPETVMTDPEGCFRERLFREWLASKNVRWDPQPAEAAWRIGILDKVFDVLKNAATRAARRAPEDTSCEAVRITVFCSAIVIDVIVHCHTAGALLSQTAENNCPYHRVVGFLILSGQFIITLVAELGIQPLIRSFWTETSAITFSTFSIAVTVFPSSTYGGDLSLSVDGACIIALITQCARL